MLSDITNWFVVAVICWCIYWKWEMYRLTKLPAVFVVMLAFATLLAVRVGVAVGQSFIAEHSRMLTSITVILFGVGIPMLVLLLRRAYKLNGNGNGQPAIMDTIAEIKRAADAAQDARTHAIDAAEAARVAAVHAVEAAKLADRATALSRIATREAGVADEASRAADDQMSRKDEL